MRWIHFSHGTSAVYKVSIILSTNKTEFIMGKYQEIVNISAVTHIAKQLYVITTQSPEENIEIVHFCKPLTCYICMFHIYHIISKVTEFWLHVYEMTLTPVGGGDDGWRATERRWLPSRRPLFEASNQQNWLYFSETLAAFPVTIGPPNLGALG